MDTPKKTHSCQLCWLYHTVYSPYKHRPERWDWAEARQASFRALRCDPFLITKEMELPIKVLILNTHTLEKSFDLNCRNMYLLSLQTQFANGKSFSRYMSGYSSHKCLYFRWYIHSAWECLSKCLHVQLCESVLWSETKRRNYYCDYYADTLNKRWLDVKVRKPMLFYILTVTGDKESNRLWPRISPTLMGQSKQTP